MNPYRLRTSSATDRIDSAIANPDAEIALRNLLIASHDRNDLADEMRNALDEFPLLREIDLIQICDAIHDMPRSELTTMLLEYSLCPLHRIDFAICFDDDDPECAAIRTIYPDTHDT